MIFLIAVLGNFFYFDIGIVDLVNGIGFSVDASDKIAPALLFPFLLYESHCILHCFQVVYVQRHV